MRYVAAVLRLLLVIIGIKLIMDNQMGSAPYLSWVAFIIIAISLCLNRIMAVKKTPCLISYFNKKK